mmetsp:Transcript_15346/g.35276  ORF Transcript_15346/g.35276 Transcript_15346/m.35276 type:complete len:399 (-) Transcript_15346:912-2108(-)
MSSDEDSYSLGRPPKRSSSSSIHRNSFVQDKSSRRGRYLSISLGDSANFNSFSSILRDEGVKDALQNVRHAAEDMDAFLHPKDTTYRDGTMESLDNSIACEFQHLHEYEDEIRRELDAFDEEDDSARYRHLFGSDDEGPEFYETPNGSVSSPASASLSSRSGSDDDDDSLSIEDGMFRKKKRRPKSWDAPPLGRPGPVRRSSSGPSYQKLRELQKIRNVDRFLEQDLDPTMEGLDEDGTGISARRNRRYRKASSFSQGDRTRQFANKTATEGKRRGSHNPVRMTPPSPSSPPPVSKDVSINIHALALGTTIPGIDVDDVPEMQAPDLKPCMHPSPSSDVTIPPKDWLERFAGLLYREEEEMAEAESKLRLGLNRFTAALIMFAVLTGSHVYLECFLEV